MISPVIVPFRAQIDDSLRQRCAKKRYPEPTRSGGSRRGALCSEHHAAAMRTWRTRRRQAGKSVVGASVTPFLRLSRPLLPQHICASALSYLANLNETFLRKSRAKITHRSNGFTIDGKFETKYFIIAILANRRRWYKWPRRV